MSRSFRHTPIIGIACADSEKDDKRLWHRKMRARERANLSQCCDWNAFMTTAVNEVSDPWGMNKDGHHYLHRHSRYYLRSMRK